ncbi:spermidine/putrescine ABC transporter substrate-binding protein [Frankia sp. CNm7]|uniref:Spermidine/putrescine ABC transporter substrate-binding protein n=1 Tax=Frankia nepalensis TaxID=1836974 RepID=A0A937UVM4_9ACTN|nr:spermidine/putrescine ABC transporter substrate-binding protein [Frankia nepalensis]MBL7495194.1 spermidine/putrescine ABC transporter substrate-binding protein [Frankia nepalensis]MBL7510240.1 spermidine/putrescine ABC transporter substrate-binding protein [Frankia nepalensis]MBL7524858.1 spermidine/putrescine ABC transporter substrate-binding protein [Frankia nepalensis]MBL7632431.1 spermidine/putrescine ABC transporter substrate-binding protein [Frankia nepalensis]
MTTHGSPDSSGPHPTPVPAVDPALLRGLTQPRLGRRGFLRLGGAAGVAALLAACGVEGEKSNDSSGTAPEDFWDGKEKAGVLNFANWPLYIDVADDGSNPSLKKFEDEKGIKVTYREVIQDNESFFATIRPQLAANQSTGHDLIVMTNGLQLDKLIALGYLAPLDLTKLPNFVKNADASVKNPAYDQGNKYTVAWQSGITGIAYDPEKTGREITSYEDLFDPAFAGHVGMFGENQDLPNLALVGMGIDPTTSTPDDWKKAADKLTKQREDGIVRKYYVQDYIDPLAAGDLWITMAWSGDVFQQVAAGSNLKFVVPQEGAILWTDNMCIPKTAEHPVDAITYMDFAYEPEVAAMLADYINYITPVQSAKSLVSPEIGESPLIFPSQEDLANTHRFRVLTTEEETEWNKIFQPVYQS